MTRWERLSLATVRRMPPLLVAEPERVTLKSALAAMGALSLLSLSEPGTLYAILPVWLVAVWSVNLIVGGVSTIVGMVTSRRSLERAGVALTVSGCLVYAVALASTAQPRTILVGMVFLAFGLAGVARLMISSASAAMSREARDDLP